MPPETRAKDRLMRLAQPSSSFTTPAGPASRVAALAALIIITGCANGSNPPPQSGYVPYGGPNTDVAPCIDTAAHDGTGVHADGVAGADAASDAITGRGSDTVGSQTDVVAVNDSQLADDTTGSDIIDAPLGDTSAADATSSDATTTDATSSDATTTDTIAVDSAAGDAAIDVVVNKLSFGYVYQEVIAKFGCASALCHGNKSGEMAYFIDQKAAYGLLVNKASKVKECQFLPLVFPGKPENSVLYTKIKDGTKTCGDKMPVGSDGLPDAISQIVYDWIKAGAPK
jgi:hypothetical protein